MRDDLVTAVLFNPRNGNVASPPPKVTRTKRETLADFLLLIFKTKLQYYQHV